jgi:hypothetical protein
MATRMSEFFFSEAEFLLDQDQQFNAPLSEELWAQLVFIDPISIVPKLSAASSYGDSLSGKELTALYADWQTRESEIGYALVERRKQELSVSLESYRSSLDRRQRTISSARARLQTIQRINATEPDETLRYPREIIEVLEEKIQTSEIENQYLRLYMSRMAALSSVLQTMGATGRSDVVEQYCRLIGQTWRGQMKLKAFQKKFPGAVPKQQPLEGIQAIIAGEIIQHSASESPMNTDIVLSHVTVAYLIHLLKTITILADQARSIFDPSKQAAQLNGEWPPIMVLLSAIVEMFYYCSFEMAYSSYGRVVEQVSGYRVWDFNPEKKDWEQFTEKTIDQLRRQATETSMLLVEYPPFLRCTNAEDVTNACQTALTRVQPAALSQAYGPYQFTGLAKMEQRSDSRNFKFHNAGMLTSMVLDHIVSLDPQLKAVFYSPAGGPMKTLVSMANLEMQGFGLAAGEEWLVRSEVLRVLSNFWKRMGKKRPVALLGDAYAKNIYAGMASIGESAPEFSSLLSIHLTNVFGTNLFGANKGPTDLLMVLMLADQIRLVDLLDLSRSYMQAVISDLQAVKTLPEIGELIKKGGSFSHYEQEIGKRFNQKWLAAKQPIWTILRSTAPHAWGFWAKLATGDTVAQLLGGVDPGQALGFLFLPLADIVRLMLLFETSSPVLAERQKVDSETAARELLSGFAIFRNWPSPLGPIIEEHISYYFDPAIQHDAWLSFTESLKEHISQISVDLQARQANPGIIDMISTMIMRLNANYPSPQRPAVTAVVIKAEEQRELPDCEFDESDCQFLQILCNDLLSERGLTHIIFLKMLALWRYKVLREAIRNIYEYRKLLRELLDEQSLRITLLNMPAALRQISELLPSMKGTGNGKIDDEKAASVIDCLSKQRELQHQLEALLAMPTFPFDKDRQRISELSVKTNGEHADLLLMISSNIPSLILVNEEEPAAAILRYEAELKNRAERQFPDWNPEPLLLGAITLTASRAGLALSNSPLEVDPIFHEPDKPNSARLLWSFASKKFGLTLRLLQTELTDSIVSIRL